ncbi:hypothetical protein GDO86_015383 [Hymenochirus boettgeri]|uniref:Solute carrier family 25 member 43 n=1 Tax=Hymenochirus boettgeri TaxID=247094 RepID=A0A8T2JYJ7_9PIPI|nr:hypothetical protein GDO86_015383 [Hymenochirus boettgeri]
MITLTRDTRLTAWQSFLCGGVAGVLGRTVTSPLDVVKILSQVGTFHSKHGFLGTFRLLCKAEGLRALWKGNLTACMRLFPYSAVQLALYHRFTLLFVDDLGHISKWKAIVSGGVAGAVAAVVIYPTDVIKTRLIVQNSREPSYRGIIHALCSIYYQEGFLSLYKGVSLIVLGAIPFSASLFLIDLSLDRLWQESSVPLTPLQHFVNGCLAGGVAQTLSFPFETVKRKMQAQSCVLPHCGGVDVHFSGILDCFTQTVKIKGVLSLWNGLSANLIKVIPYFGLMLGSFECCKRLCLYHNGYIVSPLGNQLTPGVDQSLQPHELQELRKFLRSKEFVSRKPPLNG